MNAWEASETCTIHSHDSWVGIDWECASKNPAVTCCVQILDQHKRSQVLPMYSTIIKCMYLCLSCIWIKKIQWILINFVYFIWNLEEKIYLIWLIFIRSQNVYLDPTLLSRQVVCGKSWSRLHVSRGNAPGSVHSSISISSVWYKPGQWFVDWYFVFSHQYAIFSVDLLYIMITSPFPRRAVSYFGASNDQMSAIGVCCGWS